MINTAQDPSPQGWFRSLWPGEAGLLAEHLVRLAPEDRHRRFLHAVNDDWMRDYARRAGRRRVLGWFVDGTLRGAAEVHFRGDVAEAALSVEAPWRGNGVGLELMRRALRAAQNYGVRTLTVYTTADNTPMIRIAKALDARFSREDGTVTGEIDAGPPTPASLIFDLADEERGLIANWWSGVGAGMEALRGPRAG